MSNIKINSTGPRIQYTATASQTEFTIPFPWTDNDYIFMYQRAAGSTADDATDIILQGVSAGNYSLSGVGTADGGTATLVTPATVGDIITIVGDETIDRTTIINTTLNTQLNDLTIFCKQTATVQGSIMLRYNESEEVTALTDTVLPHLTASGVWRKNAGNTAIEVATLPPYPVGSTGGNFSNDNRMVKTDTSTSDNNIQETGVTIDDSNVLTGLAGMTVAGLTYPTSDGAAGYHMSTDGAGNLSFSVSGTGDVDGPASSTDNALARFDGTTGKILQNSGVILDDTDSMTGVANITVATNITNTALTASRAVVTDGSSVLASSATTATEIGYVSGVTSGIQSQINSLNTAAGFARESVELTSVVALTVTYDNGTAGVGATLTNAGAQAAFAADGVTASVNDRILVKTQASALQNGIYSVTTVGDGSTNWVLTRATDADTPSLLEKGIIVYVISGNTQARRGFFQSQVVTTVGTDAINFGLLDKDAVRQTGSPIFGADAEVSDAYAVTLDPVPSAYTTGMVINFSANTANTGAATLNVNGLGAIAIKKHHDQDVETGDIESGQILTVVYDGTNFQMQSQIAKVASGIGRVLQVVQGTFTTTASVASTTPADTGITVSITPSSTSSKVLVLATIQGSSTGFQGYYHLVKDSTNLLEGTSVSSRTACTSGVYADISTQMPSSGICYLDSPATISATVYKIQFSVQSGGTCYINRSSNDADSAPYPRGASSIIALEIQG